MLDPEFTDCAMRQDVLPKLCEEVKVVEDSRIELDEPNGL